MEKKYSVLTKASLSLLSFLFLNACTTLNRIPLEKAHRQSVIQSEQILTSEQKNIQVEKMEGVNYVPGGAGLAGAVVGVAFSSIIANNENTRAEKSIQPLKKHFKNGYFNQMMSQNINQELASVKWLHLNKSRIMTPLTETQQINQTNNLKQFGDALVYVNISYKLSKSSLNALQVTADVSIYKKENPKAVLIYKNKFEYYDRLEKQKTVQDYVYLWSEQDGAKLKNSMQEAAQILSSLIVEDINDPSIKPNKKRPTNVWYNDSKTANNTGYLEGHIKNKDIIRTTTGEIIAVNSSLVEQKHNWRE